jgi:hypothetical protein
LRGRPVQPAPSGMIGERSEASAGRSSESGRRTPLHFGGGVHGCGGGGFEPPTFGLSIPLLLATFVGQLTDSQVPDQFELLAPIGPPIQVVCEHSHV